MSAQSRPNRITPHTSDPDFLILDARSDDSKWLFSSLSLTCTECEVETGVVDMAKIQSELRSLCNFALRAARRFRARFHGIPNFRHPEMESCYGGPSRRPS
jgi:hypothetical protein